MSAGLILEAATQNLGCLIDRHSIRHAVGSASLKGCLKDEREGREKEKWKVIRRLLDIGDSGGLSLLSITTYRCVEQLADIGRGLSSFCWSRIGGQVVSMLPA